MRSYLYSRRISRNLTVISKFSINKLTCLNEREAGHYSYVTDPVPAAASLHIIPCQNLLRVKRRRILRIPALAVQQFSRLSIEA